MKTVNFKSRSASGIAWSGLANSVRQLLTFGFYAVLARLLDPASFGVVALAGVFLAFVQIFLTQGVATALIQRSHLEKEHIDSAFWMESMISVILFSATFLVAPLAARFFAEPQLVPVLRVLSLSLLLLPLSAVPKALLTREMLFRPLAMRTLVSVLIGGIVGTGCAFLGMREWSLVAQQLCSQIAAVLLLWSSVDWRPHWGLSLRHIREIYGFSANITANNLLWVFSQRIDHVVIGNAFGTTMLGAYSVAAKIIDLLVDIVGTPFATVALPAFSRVQNDPPKLHAALYRFTETACWVAFPAFTGIALTAPLFVPLIFGESWHLAIPLTQVLAVYGAFRVAFNFFHPLMLASGRPGLYFILFVLQSLVIGLSCLWASRYNVSRVALVLGLSSVMTALLFLPVIRSVTNIRISMVLKAFALPAIASLIMAIGVQTTLFFLPSGLPRVASLAALMTVGVGIYVLSIAIFRPGMVGQTYGFLLRKFDPFFRSRRPI